MKTKNLLLIVIVSILSISCANSKKIVYANDIKKLNDTQLSLLEHTKNTYTTSDTKILLPTELNMLLGDSAIAENIETHPQWKNAYFVKDREDDVLVVPMKSNHNEVELFSDLIVTKKDSIYPKMLSTYLEFKNDKTTKYIQIESSIKGEFYNAKILDENNKVVATYKYNGVKYLAVTNENREKNSCNNFSQFSYKKVRTVRQYMNERNQQERNQDMNALIKYEFRTRDRSNTK